MIYCSRRSVPQKVLLLSGVTHYVRHNCIKHISYVNKRGNWPLRFCERVLDGGGVVWHLHEVEEVLDGRNRRHDIAEFLLLTHPPPPEERHIRSHWQSALCHFLVDSIDSWV